MATNDEPPKFTENLIEIRVNDVAQLFQTLDPFPFRERDLADEAEDYIVGWAREMPRNNPIKIVVHIPEPSPFNMTCERVVSSGSALPGNWRINSYSLSSAGASSRWLRSRSSAEEAG